jgi:hypothetical protein
VLHLKHQSWLSQSTSPNDCDQILKRLTVQRQAWLQVSIPERIDILQCCLLGVEAVAAEWVAAACTAKGSATDALLAGEEWLSGPAAVIKFLQQLIQSLRAGGQLQPVRWRQIQTEVGQSQYIAEVFPKGLAEALLWLRFRAEIWLEPGKPTSQGQIYRPSAATDTLTATGKVALVLGAGNIASIAPLDCLDKLFVHNQVVLLKMNPVNAYLGPFLEKAFQPLAAYFAIVYGGAEVGQYLCQHPLVETLHITGSHHTYNAILGVGRDSASTSTPLLTKPITSELGNVTPILVVPGAWSEADIQFQARHVASMVAHNASFNCTAAQVLVTAQGWPLQPLFLAAVRQALAKLPHRHAYYPGAVQRYQQCLAQYPQALPLGDVAASGDASTLPWTVIPEVPAQAGEYALSQEVFCGILAEVSLPGTTAREFLAQAVPFVNQGLWGNLCCVLLIHPQSQKQLGKDWPQTLAVLRYGTIGVNVWTGVSFALGVTTWGAFPGNSDHDIQSGRGVVHNSYLFDYPQKSVLYAPFRIWPTPAWFADHQNLLSLGQRLTAYEAHPNLVNGLRLVMAASRG